MGRLMAVTKRKYTFIFCTLVKAELLIRRRSSERLENDLSVRLILMSTDRLSLRSNALMIMDHLYRILHFPPKNIRSKLLSIPWWGALGWLALAFKNTFFFKCGFLRTLFFSSVGAFLSELAKMEHHQGQCCLWKKQLNFDGRLLISTWETIARRG